MIEKKVTLRLGECAFPEQIRVSQFDTMWRFVFSIVYNSQPWIIPRSGGSLNTTAILNGRKPDGNVFAFDGTINGDNTVTVDADVQMTAVAGQTVCELIILSDGKVVGTANFILDVEAAPKAPEDVSSESTLPAYGEILDRIAEMEGGGGGSVTVDDALSSTSENPVQNKVVKAALDNKVDKVSGKGLSTNDYTTTEKSKLAGIQAGAQVNPDLSGYATKTEMNTALGGKADSSALAAKADKVIEVTVATDGAVTQALEAGKWYHFTGALTGLTITLTAPASGELAQYHFDFISGATAPTVTLPDSVVMPNGFSVDANKRYEVDILNNYGVVMTWAIS